MRERTGSSIARRRGAVPKLPASRVTFESFLEAFERHQAVLVRGCLQHAQPRAKQKRAVTLAALRRMYARHSRILRRAFCLESTLPAAKRRRGPAAGAGTKADVREDPAARLLGSSRPPAGPWYASFVVQRSKRALDAFLQTLPFATPPFLQGARGLHSARHSDAVWVFFGRNPGTRALTGRSEHTDVITHDGTWHLQLQGSKVWTLRPTAELVQRSRQLRGVGRVRVHCKAGDVLCVNTSLWWHSTRIPGPCGLSLSVARDMYLDGSQPGACDMSNVDGHYATRTVPRGAVVFTEDDAPDVELPRSNRSNCGVRDMEGRLAVIAKRLIKPGEWLCVSDSEAEG